MKEIFISYSTVDIAQAEAIRNILERNGISCWMAPRDIPGGSNYTREIPIAIRNCKVFLLVLSTNSQSSPWVLKELDAAVNSAKVILPFMLENFALNDEFNFLLSGTQRYMAYQKNSEAVEALIRRIRSIIGAEGNTQESFQTTATISPETTQSHTPPSVIPTAPMRDTVCCPACRADTVTVLTKKFKLESSAELPYKAIPFLLSLLSFVIGTVILVILDATTGVAFIGMVVSIILGVIWGRHVALKKVTQYRFRHGKKVECFCCNRCKKTFNITTALQ